MSRNSQAQRQQCPQFPPIIFVFSLVPYRLACSVSFTPLSGNHLFNRPCAHSHSSRLRFPMEARTCLCSQTLLLNSLKRGQCT